MAIFLVEFHSLKTCRSKISHIDIQITFVVKTSRYIQIAEHRNKQKANFKLITPIFSPVTSSALIKQDSKIFFISVN